MGKVLVTGHAEKDVAPDYAKVVLTVKAEGETADKATASALSEFERLISELIKTGFDNDSMTIMSDHGNPASRYDIDYSVSRSVCIRIPADMKIVNCIHDIIASGLQNTTFDIRYDLSSRAEELRELNKLAIQNSRKIAEQIAEATGSRIIGIKAANFDDEDMDMNIADLDVSVTPPESIYYCRSSRALSTSFSDQLNPEKITLEANVRIVWQLE